MSIYEDIYAIVRQIPLGDYLWRPQRPTFEELALKHSLL